MQYNCLISRKPLELQDEVAVIPILPSNLDFKQKLPYGSPHIRVTSEIQDYNELFEMSNGYIEAKVTADLSISSVKDTLFKKFFEFKYKVPFEELFKLNTVDVYDNPLFKELLHTNFQNFHITKKFSTQDIIKSLLDLGFKEYMNNVYKREANKFEYTVDKYSENNFYGEDYIELVIEEDGSLSALNYYLNPNEYLNLNINNFGKILEEYVLEDGTVLEHVSKIHLDDHYDFLNKVAKETGILLGVSKENQKKVSELSNMKFTVISLEELKKSHVEASNFEFQFDNEDSYLENQLNTLLFETEKISEEYLKNTYLKMDLNLKMLKGNTIELLKFLKNNKDITFKELKKNLEYLGNLQIYLNNSKIILLPALISI